jgi:thiopeptide-type bacteriocin biosynthesis protein
MTLACEAGADCEDVLIVGRVPALPIATARALYESDDLFAELRRLLRADPAIRAAIRLASPALYSALDVWLEGGVPKNKRTPLSLLGYVLRMAARCTPFGLFASVGAVETGAGTTLGLSANGEQRISARPDARWLCGVLDEAQRDPDAIWSAQVVANDLVVQHADALYVMHGGHAGRVDGGGRTPVWRYDAVHVRVNEAVNWLRATAAVPLRIDELVGRTCERLRASSEIALRLVRKLLDAGVLTFMRPSLLGDPFAALITLLAEHPQREHLGALAREVAAFERTGAGSLTPEDIGALDEAFQRRHAVDGNAFGIDVVHDFDGCLGANVVRDAACLAKVMLADGAPARLDAQVRAFITRYESLDRRIPLLELVHDDFVLAAEDEAVRPPARRTALLAGIAAGAVRERVREVSLDDGTFDRLFPGLRASRLTQTCEAGFMVCAPDRAAIECGDYLIVPTAGANSSGVAKSASRFNPVIGAAFSERAARARSARTAAGTPVADLDYFPFDARSGNLIMRPPVHRYAIADAATVVSAGVQRISPSDILIGVEDGRFIAYAKSLGRAVEIDESYLLETGYFAPPHMRFLSQIANQERRTPRPFDWGSAAQVLPFLPRLRYGRVVLAVARWLVPRDELAGERTLLASAIARFRSAWDMPRWVYLAERDVKLLLDLDSPIALELLRDQLPKLRGDSVLFEEMLPGFDGMWLIRNGTPVAHEFVATFVAAEPARPAARDAAPRFEPPALPLGPASPWVFVKLYACRNELHALTRDVVPDVVSACGGSIDRWFFVRYRDPDHHLRLRLHAADGRGTVLAERVMHVLEPLLQSGRLARYSFDTYCPEPERFGGGAALEPVEAIFHAGSARIVAALAVPDARETPGSLALRSAAPFLRAWFATFDLERWLEAAAERSRAAGPIDYAFVRRVRRWLDEPGAPADTAEKSAIAALAALEAAGTLNRPSGYVLGAILHLHFNRAGVAYDDEPRLEAHLWRALSATLRRAAAAG